MHPYWKQGICSGNQVKSRVCVCVCVHMCVRECVCARVHAALMGVGERMGWAGLSTRGGSEKGGSRPAVVTPLPRGSLGLWDLG